MKKRVIVTGSSSGIGYLTAEKLAENGHSLILVARRIDRLHALKQACCDKHGIRAEVVEGDIGDFSLGERVNEVLCSMGSGEPVLINNAGSAVFGDYKDQTFESHWKQIEVNLGGAMAMTHAVLPEMLRFGSGQLIQVLSIAAESVFPGAAVYSAAKAGLRQFGRSLSEEYRKAGVRVTNLLPGAVDTPLWESQGGSPPRNQMLSAENVASMIVSIVESPASQVVEEIRLTPPFGIL